jgi:hypothetical protein
MLRSISFLTVAAVLLLFPTRLLAGGPPWLCLPIDGVTAGNAKACADFLTAELKDKSAGPGWDRGVQIHQHANQWYLTFYMGKDVALSDVEAALKGSSYSIPRDRLRLFGHVILEIDAGKAAPKELLAALDKLDYVSIEKTDDKDNLFLVTLDMPYPVEDGGRDGLNVAFAKFQRNDFASDQSTKTEPATTSRELPSYKAFRDVVAAHKASLKDVRWSAQYACRPLGGVAVEAEAVASAKK